MAPVATAMSTTNARDSVCGGGGEAIGSGYRRPSPRFAGGQRPAAVQVSGRSDVAAASALGGDAGQRGEDQWDGDEGEPDPEDKGEHERERPHPHDQGPDGRARERLDVPGTVGQLGVVTILGPFADRLDLAEDEVLVAVEAPMPEEIVEAGHEAEQRDAEEHQAPAVLVAPEPVHEADQPEERPEEDQEEGLSLHTPALTFPLACPLEPADRPWGTTT